MGTIHDITQERGKRSGGPRYDSAYRQNVRRKYQLAWTLHKQGLSYGKIAELLGYSGPSGAYHLMHSTLITSSGGDAA